MELGLKKVMKRMFGNFVNSYREKLFNEELFLCVYSFGYFPGVKFW
jgi:hypothetical protein